MQEAVRPRFFGARFRSASAAAPPHLMFAFASRARSLSAAAAAGAVIGGTPHAAPDPAARAEALRYNFLSCLIITAPHGFGHDVEPFLALSKETWCEEQLFDAVKDLPHGALPLRDGAGAPLLDERGEPRVDPCGMKRTRLMYAAQAGDVPRLQWLLARGARQELKDWQGFTALHWACNAGRLETACLLMARPGACIRGTGPSGGLTPLLVASYLGKVEVVRELLARGAPLNAELKPGDAPSASRPPAAYAGATPLYAAAAGGHTEVVQVLLEWGAPLTTAKGNGATPLHTACALRGGGDARAFCPLPYSPPPPSFFLPARTHNHRRLPRALGHRARAPLAGRAPGGGAV